MMTAARLTALLRALVECEGGTPYREGKGTELHAVFTDILGSPIGKGRIFRIAVTDLGEWPVLQKPDDLK